jgi:hypothetical protein
MRLGRRLAAGSKRCSRRLDSSVIGWPKSEWADTLRVIQGAIREVNEIHEAFERTSQ